MNEKIFLRHAGRRLSLFQWAAELGVNPFTAASRWRRGIRDFDKIFATGRASTRLIEYGGRKQTIADWAREIGMSRQRLHVRLQAYPVGVALGFE